MSGAQRIGGVLLGVGGGGEVGEDGGAWVQIGADGAATGAPSLSGSAASYPGAWPNTDLDYRVLPQSLKESIVLTKPPSGTASHSFTVTLGGGLTPNQNPDARSTCWARSLRAL